MNKKWKDRELSKMVRWNSTPEERKNMQEIIEELYADPMGWVESSGRDQSSSAMRFLGQAVKGLISHSPFEPPYSQGMSYTAIESLKKDFKVLMGRNIGHLIPYLACSLYRHRYQPKVYARSLRYEAWHESDFSFKSINKERPKDLYDAFNEVDPQPDFVPEITFNLLRDKRTWGRMGTSYARLGETSKKALTCGSITPKGRDDVIPSIEGAYVGTIEQGASLAQVKDPNKTYLAFILREPHDLHLVVFNEVSALRASKASSYVIQFIDLQQRFGYNNSPDSIGYVLVGLDKKKQPCCYIYGHEPWAYPNLAFNY